MSYLMEEEDRIYDKLEDVPFNDRLFDMSSFIHISKLLSVNKLKHSKVLIMNKYYLQIPNHFEQENLDDEECQYLNSDGKSEINIIEHPDGTAELTRLNELYHMCTFFNVDMKIQAEIFRQFFKLKPIYTQDARFLCHYKQCVDLLKEATRHYVTQQFQDHNLVSKNQIEAKKKMCDIILECTHIYPNIFDLQFKYEGLDALEELVINERTNEISAKQLQDFSIWKQFYSLVITTVNKCFSPKYNTAQKMTAVQLQEFVNNSQNAQTFDPKQTIPVYVEELYFNVSQRQTDYAFNNKVFLELRENKGSPFLVTKSNSEHQIARMFTKFLNAPNCLSLDLEETIDEFDRISSDIQATTYGKYFAFTIKDFLMNIDYKFVEQIGYSKLAKYLRERKLYYIDPYSHEEVEINNKNGNKGIFYGEVFASDLCTMICQILSEQLVQIINQQTTYNTKVYHTQQSFLIYLTSDQLIKDDFDENEDAAFATRLLEICSSHLQKYGFEVDNSTINYYQCKMSKKLTLLKMDNNNTFVNSTDFIFNNRQMINNTIKPKEFTHNQIEFLVKLMKKNQQPYSQLIKTPFSEIEQFITLRLLKKYIKKSNDERKFKEKLSQIYEDLFTKVEIPCYVNKVPFFN